VATTGRLPTNIGLFCKRALYKWLFAAKERFVFKETTTHSHPTSSKRDLYCLIQKRPILCHSKETYIPTNESTKETYTHTQHASASSSCCCSCSCCTWCARCTWQKFTKVSSLLNTLHNMAIGVTLQNFYSLTRQCNAHNAIICNKLQHTATHCNTIVFQNFYSRCTQCARCTC